MVTSIEQSRRLKNRREKKTHPATFFLGDGLKNKSKDKIKK